ncbi:MAG TPA: alpha/beta fold hydrolase, partial [Thermodesulfobacteriota bacterium]|nr:alpha/beta fold hydrolase [Thermodesulfobacteriota bacterium]
FIAQELALRHPDLVRSLVLVSTNSGRGSIAMRSSPHLNGLLKLWGILPGSFEMAGKASAPLGIEYGLKKEDKIRYGLSLAFTPEYYRSHPDEIERIVRWRMESPQPGYAWARQFTAGTKFDSSGRAEAIDAPTLVMNGSGDRIVSPERARELAERIPGARYEEMEGTGHLLFIEKADEFNERVIEFLDEAGTGQNASAESGDDAGWWDKIVSILSGGNAAHPKN